MNKQQFIQFILSPEKLNSETVNQLGSLINDFPYFQTAHLLYLKSLHNQSSIHYNSQLKITAAYVTDRKVLNNLITDKYTIEQPFTEDKKQTGALTDVTKKTEQETENIDFITDNNIYESIEKKLNAQILSEIINTTTIQEIVETNTLAEINFEDKSKTEEITITVPQLNTSGQNTFSDWLKRTKNTHNNQINIETSKQNALVNSFITTEPRLSKKTAFYSPVDMARKSVTENISIITETLAKVYMQQGNLITAKKAYENLSLKFPEKSVYFAAQIKSINKQLNSKK